jgi:hypothetical protein
MQINILVVTLVGVMSMADATTVIRQNNPNGPPPPKKKNIYKKTQQHKTTLRAIKKNKVRERSTRQR